MMFMFDSRRCVRRGAPFVRLPWLAAVFVFSTFASLPARSVELQPSSVFVQGGFAPDTHALTLGATWDWSKAWDTRLGRLSGYFELAAGRWSTEVAGGRERAWVSHFSVTPVLRVRPDGGKSPWFFEGGIGLSAITPIYRRDDASFSTTFNFCDHIAVGRNFGGRQEHELALRVQHFSNASIRKPNPGEDFLQIRYSYAFR